MNPGSLIIPQVNFNSLDQVVVFDHSIKARSKLLLFVSIAILVVSGFGFGLYFKTSNKTNNLAYQTIFQDTKTGTLKYQTTDGIGNLTTSKVSNVSPANLQTTSQNQAAVAVQLPIVCSGNKLSQLVVVSIQNQHLYACSKSQVIYNTPITSGAIQLGIGTPIGTFHILAKTKSSPPSFITLKGCDILGCWSDPVEYWMPFDNNGDGFHDSTWQTFPYGSSLYATQGSRGCVHTPITAMSWLYNWANVGATVQIS